MHCSQGFVHRHHFIQNPAVFPNTAAPDAGQIAHFQRLQHGYQRKSLSSQQFVLDDIPSHPQPQFHRAFRGFNGDHSHLYWFEPFSISRILGGLYQVP